MLIIIKECILFSFLKIVMDFLIGKDTFFRHSLQAVQIISLRIKIYRQTDGP